MTTVKDPNLRRFWFAIHEHQGIGVTAYSRSDAEALACQVAEEFAWPFDAAEVIEDVDIRDLDQGHIIPNMGPPNLRGVWYPRLNI